MIRPLTVVCFLAACGSGLYLYQTKHRVQLLDRQIEDTVRATDALREQARMLHAEWTLQNDPQRLQSLAEQFLNLKTVTPGQFTSMADLDSRLPAIKPPEPPPSAVPAEMPVAQANEPAPPEPPVPTAGAPPPPPKPAAVAAAAPQPHPAEHRQAAPPPRPVVAELPPARPRPEPAAPRPIMAATLSRSVVPAPAPFTGSALGMAHGASLSVPQPVPVSASQWVGNGNGGG